MAGDSTTRVVHLLLPPPWNLVRQQIFSEKKHFAKLRKAKLVFAVHGLRDVNPAGISEKHGETPKIIVQIKKFSKEVQAEDSKERVCANERQRDPKQTRE